MLNIFNTLCLIIIAIELMLLPCILLVTGRYIDKHIDHATKLLINLNIFQRYIHYALLIHDMDDHYAHYRYQHFAKFDFVTIARPIDIIICSPFITLAFILFSLLCGYGFILIFLSIANFTLSAWLM